MLPTGRQSAAVAAAAAATATTTHRHRLRTTQMEPPSQQPLLLGVGALQLETRPGPTADNLARIDALLAAECRRLGIRRWDAACGDAGSSGSSSGAGAGSSRASTSSSSGGEAAGTVHLDLLLLPEIFNSYYLVNEQAWYRAECLAGPGASPSLAALATWARRYRCYVAATLLEATPDGHIYNSLVVAAPDGSFVRRPGTGNAPGDSSSSSSSIGSGNGSVALVRKHRASSLEGFVFRSGGAPGRGGEPRAHVFELSATPLLAKRSSSIGGSSGGGCGGAASGSGGGAGAPRRLRLGAAICYENFCLPPMQAILVSAWWAGLVAAGSACPDASCSAALLLPAGLLPLPVTPLPPRPPAAGQEAHRAQPLDLLLAPFCAMQPAHDHPTFSWPRQAAQRFAAQAAAVSRLHALKLGLHVVACHHTGGWAEGGGHRDVCVARAWQPTRPSSRPRVPPLAPTTNLRPAGPWQSPLPRLLPFLARDPTPISGPMLGCSAIYSPGGEPLAQLGSGEEGLLLAHLPLGLQRPRPAPPSSGVSTAVDPRLASLVGEAAARSAAGGTAIPYAAHSGGYCVGPVSWHVRYGFWLVESLGAFSYHVWQAPQRRRVAQAIAAAGAWQGPVPPLDEGGTSWGGGAALAVAAAAVGAAGLAAALAWHGRA